MAEWLTLYIKLEPVIKVLGPLNLSTKLPLNSVEDAHVAVSQ